MPGSSARPARTSRGNLLRGLFVFGTLLIVGWVFLRARQRPEPERIPVDRPPAEETSPPLAVVPTVASENEPLDQASLDAVLQRSLCEIVGSGPEGNRTLGAGVIVDSRGSVLTCLHVVAETTEPAIRLPSGAILEVSGYRQIDPRLDLALLVVRDPPELSAVTWKELRDNEHPPIAAAGHPQGASFSLVRGIVQQQLATQELPPEEQAFVKRLLASADVAAEDQPMEKIWLQHSAPLQQGFSGGPLLDAHGNAVGLNLWVNETARRSFAVSAREIRLFLARPELDPPSPPAEFASLDARWRAAQWAMSGDKLRTVFDQARSLRWQPASQDDYQILQQLALGLNIARDDELLSASGRTAKHVEGLAKSAQPMMVALQEQRWRDAGQLILINEFASLAVEEFATGFFAFVRVRQILETTDKQVIVLVELSGHDERMIVRVDKTLRPPEVGEQWVLLGVQQRERLTWEDQPLPTILSHVVLPLADERKK